VTNPEERVVADLVSAGLLEQGRAPAAEQVVRRTLDEVRRSTPAEPGRTRSGLVEVAGYAGSALVVAAVGLFLLEYWDDIPGAVQVGVLVALAGVLAMAGVLLVRLGGGAEGARASRDGARRRLASTLLTLGALAAATAVVRLLTLVDLTDASTFAGALVMIGLTALAYRFVPSAVGVCGLAGGLAVAVPSGLELVSLTDDSLGLILGYLAVGALWVLAAEAGWFRERTLARAAGVGFALLGAQLGPLTGEFVNACYLATFLVAVAGFALYLVVDSWPYLVGGVLALTIVVSETVVDWTEGSIGIAGAVLVTGLTLIGASLVGLRLRHERHG
jgi:hypothetical protein